jgi:2,3,4,5-tetrahydropyridine-2-carboxylate N-succinyltransferase
VSTEDLRERVEMLAREDPPGNEEARECVTALLEALESGTVRAAEPDGGEWKVNAWVKQGILLGFRVGANRPSEMPPVFRFRDRDTFPTWDPTSTDRDVRIVPGGSTIRRGAYIGNGVVVMPPAYVNVGAWIGEGTMVDSHALVGSCAQVGAGVHLSAASQVGGVLEPVGARPVIVEDGVFVGGNCGVYEGTLVRSGAVLAAGVILTGSVPLYDLVREEVYRATPDVPLEIPAGAVVVPGSRPAAGRFGEGKGIHLQAPVIVKYRDASTDAAAALEDALR